MGMGAEEKEWGCRTNCASSRETPSRACLVNHELGRLPPSSTKGGFGGPSSTGIRTVGEAVVPHGRFTRQTLARLRLLELLHVVRAVPMQPRGSAARATGCFGSRARQRSVPGA